MNRLTLLSFLITLATLLTACKTSPKDYHYFMAHPNEIASTYAHCQTLPSSQLETNTTCTAATQAGIQINHLIQQAVYQGQNFGKSILNAQTELANLQKTLNTAKQNHVPMEQLKQQQEEINNIQYQLQVKMAVLRMMGP